MYTTHAGGNIFHGAMGLNQLFFMRPSSGFARYQTPIPGSHSSFVFLQVPLLSSHLCAGVTQGCTCAVQAHTPAVA
jgi:hypothetical protein